jgi:CHASE2 domain-containing sensor protein
LLVKYRKHDHKPGEPLYTGMDRFELHQIEEYSGPAKAFKFLVKDNALQEKDKLANALVNARPAAYWNSGHRTVAFEDVLEATPEQGRAWFGDRAIVIGQMRRDVPEPIRDLHVRGNGEEIFGCQLHAEAIDALLARIDYHRFRRAELAGRNIFWCSLGVIAVSLLRKRQWRSMLLVTLVCVGLFLAGVELGGRAALRSKGERMPLEVLMATTGMLMAGSLAFWTKAARERQLGLTPSAATMATEGPTLPSTVLAETR